MAAFVLVAFALPLALGALAQRATNPSSSDARLRVGQRSGLDSAMLAKANKVGRQTQIAEN